MIPKRRLLVSGLALGMVSLLTAGLLTANSAKESGSAIESPGALVPEECWIVDQWIDPNQGHPLLCTKRECKDGRTWTECVPI